MMLQCQHNSNGEFEGEPCTNEPTVLICYDDQVEFRCSDVSELGLLLDMLASNSDVKVRVWQLVDVTDAAIREQTARVSVERSNRPGIEITTWALVD